MNTALSRRAVLAGGSAAAAAALIPSTRANAAVGWPRHTLTGAAARRVDPARFIPRRQLHVWMEAVDDIGLRATGSRRHDRYVDQLADRMERVGIRNVRADHVPFEKWTPSAWGLEVVGGAGAGPVDVSWYVPWSGNTPAGGITARLSPVPAPGTIGIITVTPPPVPYAAFAALDWDAPVQPQIPNPADYTRTYDRAWLQTSEVTAAMSAFKQAGALGLIVVQNLPKEAAKGQYAPYDAVLRDLPSLYVDRDAGARLTQVALGGGQVRLELTATMARTSSPNLYGVIPGATSEFVMIQSHTDGTNGLEENGPEGILATAQYLARIPRRDLPRSVLVVMSTGHMIGHARGTEHFLEHHADDLVARTAAAISVEHLGAKAWLPDVNGDFRLNGEYEPGVFFSSPHDAMVKVGRQVHAEAPTYSNLVLRPFMPDTVDGFPPRSPNGFWWPGDGEGLWRVAGLPSLQYIAGPTYLLNSDMNTMRFFDAGLMRRQSIAFTNALLRLARIPRDVLRTRRPDDPSLALGR